MNIKMLKIMREMCYIATFTLILLMVFVSNSLGQKEVIFPEIAALCVGA